MLAAVLLPACGNGDQNGDNFVSVQQFSSGSAGFFIQGIGATMRIRSNGQGDNTDIVNDTRPSGNLPLPEESWQNAGGNTVQMTRPEGWETTGAVAETSKILSGSLLINNTLVAHINSMTYQLEEGGQRGYLSITYEAVGSDSSFTTGLANFFGYVSQANVSEGAGNTSSTVYVNESGQRVLLPSVAGTSVKIWFDFSSGYALMQLIGAKRYEVSGLDGDNTDETTMPGEIITARNLFFTKTLN